MAILRRMMARAALAAALGMLAAAAYPQMFPGDEEPTPASQPSTRSAAAEKPIQIIVPTVDKAAHRITMPAAFWNEKMADWVETAICGRPSDFLHETILSSTTTKTIMVAKLREAGCVDADQWVSNVADFPRIRGDKIMILLQVTRTDPGGGGKIETYPLDELLVNQGWGVSIGPFGWMFKGSPGETPAAAPPRQAPDDPKRTPQDLIYRDDPQVALRMRGMRNVSDSYIDHPLCYDDWIFPEFHYHRNYALLPAAVYDSNGDVPVTLIMQKVTEVEFLQAMAKYWHDPDFAKYILKQLPTAEQIDHDKAELWKALPPLRDLAKKAAADGTTAKLRDTDAFGKVALLSAAIERGYTALDAAWVDWSCDHVRWETKDPADIKELEAARALWRTHIEQNRDRAVELWKAQVAAAKLRDLAQQPDNAARQAALRQARGEQLAAQSRATLLENAQVLQKWQYEKNRLTADDPRTDWRKHIDAQLTLAQCRDDMGHKGIALGDLLQQDGQDKQAAAAGAAYQQAVVATALAGLRMQLADVEFEITKREQIDNDPDLPAFLKQRDAIQERIKQMEAATQPATK